MSNAGTAGWRLFTDALDEAHAAGFTGDRRRSGRPKRHLADIEMKQLKQAEQIRRRLDKQLIAMGPDWVPDETFMNAHAQATQSISSLSRSLRLAKKAEHETRSKLTPDELDAAFLIELRRIAISLDEHQWRTLLAAGMGADIAEAAVAAWKQRQEEIKASRRGTQIVGGKAP